MEEALLNLVSVSRALDERRLPRDSEQVGCHDGRGGRGNKDVEKLLPLGFTRCAVYGAPKLQSTCGIRGPLRILVAVNYCTRNAEGAAAWASTCFGVVTARLPCAG